MSEYTRQMPVVVLKDMAVMPGMLIHFDINRKLSVKAVEEAMMSGEQVFLVAQKDASIEEPEREHLFEVGTIALIKQLIKLPGNVIRVLVVGEETAVLNEITSSDPFIKGIITPRKDYDEELYENEQEAMIRSLKDILEVYLRENQSLNGEIVKQLQSITDIKKLVEQVSIHIPMSLEEKQEILEATNFINRYERLLVILTNEIEIIRIRKELQAKVKDKVDKNQKDYILREQLKVIREELGESNSISDAEEFMKKAKQLHATEEIKSSIYKEIERYKNIANSSSESAVSRTYIETLLSLPWDKTSKDRNDIKQARKILDNEHYGLEKVKERILEFLAVKQLKQDADSPILCLVGPPGTGKTSIARSLAKALQKEYVRISLGGSRDEAEIRGHRRTYVGALPGRIAKGLISANVKNPLMLLDEIDKVGSNYKGDIAAALLEVLDGEQNSKFVDHYVELPIDLSKVLFVATANSLQTIPRPLLDRMEIIEVNSYTANEKLHIAKDYLVKKQIVKHGLKKDQISISKSALEKIVLRYTREAGVRTLERRIGDVCRKVAKDILEKEDTKYKVTDKNIEYYLGKEKYNFEKANETDEIGIVRGLAWTNVGGDTLQIEVNALSGRGSFELTGQLGDVMKESARAGISFIRSVSEKYEIPEDYFKKHDIHIHIPQGAVPKDGPSAGITMATAMLSAITKRKVRHDIAMTGEITLRGRVLPIGGLKEKLLAAKMAGIKLVLIPDQNQKDVDEIEDEIKEGITIIPVKTMTEVLKYAFA